MSNFGATPAAIPMALAGATGITSTATRTLKTVAYPNRLNDIAVFGRSSAWERSWLLRPKYAGRYLFLLYPVDSVLDNTVLRREVSFPNFNSAPKTVVIQIPIDLRTFRHWHWRLIKIEEMHSVEQELELSDFELLETVQRSADGLLDGKSAMDMAYHANNNDSLTYLLYDVRPVMEADIEFSEESDRAVSRMVAWSCHQPYVSESNGAKIPAQRSAIMQWYAQEVGKFEPHRIWALGDTSYSDGTRTLDFVAQIKHKVGWQNNWDLRQDLLSLYRLNYRFHWSFDAMQEVMRRYPHLAMWDDHEIRDGYGSDAKDFSDENVAMKQIASQAAQEYLFSWNTPLRSESKRNVATDNHLAYVDNPIASFIFDGRNSRNYGDDLLIAPDIAMIAAALVSAGFILGSLATGGVGLISGVAVAGTTLATTIAIEKHLIDRYRWDNPGAVISDQQLQDFERFCQHIAKQPNVRYLLLGNSVPFIYVNDYIESIASELELMATDLGQNARDDIRDSWHSPANRRQLNRLINIMRQLHHKRPDMEMINLSGDIHISNAFSYQPPEFAKRIYQVTSSGLTNPPSIANENVTNFMSVDGSLGFLDSSEDFGDVHRLWHEGVYQNFLTVEATEQRIDFNLRVYNHGDNAIFGSRDKRLVI